MIYSVPRTIRRKLRRARPAKPRRLLKKAQKKRKGRRRRRRIRAQNWSTQTTRLAQRKRWPSCPGTHSVPMERRVAFWGAQLLQQSPQSEFSQPVSRSFDILESLEAHIYPRHTPNSLFHYVTSRPPSTKIIHHGWRLLQMQNGHDRQLSHKPHVIERNRTAPFTRYLCVD